MPMRHARPLPSYLVQRFHGWKATTYSENRAWFRRLADGQHPRAMVITCCDSRVHVSSVFGAEEGEFFIHRNVASLVPPFQADGEPHGTSATIEFAVCDLKVAHLLVVSHAHCGGVAACHAKHAGTSHPTAFIGRWMDLLDPGYERVRELPATEQVPRLEREAVVVSLENLMTFPFVKAAVEAGDLTVHGLWLDPGEGVIEQYLPETESFEPV